MRWFARTAVIALGGLLLTACAGQSTIYNEMISPAYRPYEYGYGAGRRDLTTIIVGNPFEIDQTELEARLVAMLNESPTFLQPTHFTTTPGPSARPQYRAVMLFNRQIVLPSVACRAPERVPVAELGDTMRLTALFCRYGGYLSTVTGELRSVSGIDDPRFHRLIRRIVPLLFPPVDPTRDGNSRSRLLITMGEVRASGG